MFHIVEDNTDIREIMVDFITMLGHPAKPFASPAEYLNYLNSESYSAPSAVITDVHMPGMSGYEMIDHVLPKRPEIKFVVSSGEPQIQGKLKEKACLFLLKPFRLNDFNAIISKIKICEQMGPSLKVGCSEVGNFREFGVVRNQCPKLCTHCIQ